MKFGEFSLRNNFPVPLACLFLGGKTTFAISLKFVIDYTYPKYELTFERCTL